MQANIRSGWVKINNSNKKQNIQYYSRVPIAQSPTSTVYYGEVTTNNQHNQNTYEKTKIVIKKYHKHVNEDQIAHFNDLLSKTDSPHLLRPRRKIYRDMETKRPWEIYEYCSSGTLQSLYELDRENKKNTKERRMNIIYCLLEGYKGLKQHKILHGDLTPKSIFLQPDTALLGDIGTKFINLMSESDNKTIRYIAPQRILQILQRDKEKKQDKTKETEYEKGLKQDIYSLGVIIYELMFYDHPYQKDFHKYCVAQMNFDNQNQAYIDYIQSPNIVISSINTYTIKNLSQEAKAFKQIVEKMISINPQTRPSFESVYDTFKKIETNQQKYSVENYSSFLTQNGISHKLPNDISLFEESQSFHKSPQSNAYKKFLLKAQHLPTTNWDNQQISVSIRQLSELIESIDEDNPYLVQHKEQQLSSKMTQVVNLSLNILQLIDVVRSKQDVKVVKCLLDYHSIFVTKLKLSSKEGQYFEFEDQNKPTEELLEEVNSLCKNYMIDEKKLILSGN